MHNELKKIVIGTANLENQYGFLKNKLKFEEFKKIVHLARKNNISSLDVSSNYKDVFSLISELNINNWKVFNKISEIPKNQNYIEDYILTLTQENLKKSKIKIFEGLMLHWPWELNKDNCKKINKSLQRVKKLKISRKIGISLYSNFLKKDYLNLIDLDFIQNPFNLVDQSLLKKDLINYLKKKRINICIRSIFLQGILLNAKLKNKNIFKNYSVFLSKLKRFERLNKTKLLDLNLKFIFSYKFFSNVVIGFDNFKSFKQVIEIIKYKNNQAITRPKLLISNNKKIINPYEWNYA